MAATCVRRRAMTTRKGRSNARHVLLNPSQGVKFGTDSRGAGLVCAAASASSVADKYVLANGVVDYYEVLGVDDDASMEEIKKAYRALARECHPDYLGDEGHNICVLLNEAYEVLSSASRRQAYDVRLEEALMEVQDDFDGKPLSKWVPEIQPKMAKNVNPKESRAVFVDEVSCIGCKNCIYVAAATFRLEPEYGRSRVFGQWLNTEDELNAAIESCPVSCIHWVDRSDLSALEYVMQKVITDRPNVGIMMSGQGSKVPDVWNETARFMRMRQDVAKERAAAAQRYSSAQQDAYRRAAEQLWQNGSWFNDLSQMFSGAVNSMADTMSNMVDNEDSLVGRRKRGMKWNQRQQAQEAVYVEPGYSVPPERALVPISVYAQEK